LSEKFYTLILSRNACVMVVEFLSLLPLWLFFVQCLQNFCNYSAQTSNGHILPILAGKITLKCSHITHMLRFCGNFSHQTRLKSDRFHPSLLGGEWLQIFYKILQATLLMLFSKTRLPRFLNRSLRATFLRRGLWKSFLPRFLRRTWNIFHNGYSLDYVLGPVVNSPGPDKMQT
jgi:hypothetical protein